MQGECDNFKDVGRRWGKDEGEAAKGEKREGEKRGDEERRAQARS